MTIRMRFRARTTLPRFPHQALPLPSPSASSPATGETPTKKEKKRKSGHRLDQTCKKCDISRRGLLSLPPKSIRRICLPGHSHFPTNTSSIWCDSMKPFGSPPGSSASSEALLQWSCLLQTAYWVLFEQCEQFGLKKFWGALDCFLLNLEVGYLSHKLNFLKRKLKERREAPR